MKDVSISELCRLLGENRQRYYRMVWSEKRSRERATEVVECVKEVRTDMPRLGGRKLYHILYPWLRSKGVGRDRLFDILRANGMLIRPVRSYHVTTNSHHRFHKYKNLEPLIHHSDRGIQYCSDQYQEKLHNYGIIASMTESYDPYANAIAERVNGILKQEFLLEGLNLSLPLMKKIVKESVATYNTKRPHISCDYKTPEYMHHQCALKIKTYRKADKKTLSEASDSV